MEFYFYRDKLAYERYKSGNCSQESRDNLAKTLEKLKHSYLYNGCNQSEILSYIIGEKVEYDELLVNRIISDIRYQGSMVIVPSPELPEWRACLVGNIIDEHEYGENHEVRRGTKHFGPGSKVYLAPIQWGDGYEQIYVIGKPRNSFKLIQIIMPRSRITNFRAQKVYSPTVLEMMQKSEIKWWDSDEKTIDALNELALCLNDHNFKYGTAERKVKVAAVLDILSNKYNVSNQTISKPGQLYPVVNINAFENCISTEYYGYVHEDFSPYTEYYYQISAEEIAKKIEKQIESYNKYLKTPAAD